MAKLRSMDVTIRGVTQTYEFDPATPVDSDDEGEASLQLVNEAETTEVVLDTKGITSARVSVSFTVRYDDTVSVDLEDLEGVEDADDLVYQVEMGNFSVVQEAIEQEVNDNVTYGDYIQVDSVEVDELFDEDGVAIEE